MKKYKTIIIMGSAPLCDKAFHISLFKKADLVICADGGANNTSLLGITPNYVIGDLDSIKASVYTKLKKNNETKIIEDPDQNKTDLELAISLAESFKPINIIILGAISDKLDHTLANILCLDRINPNIKAKIVDENTEIYLIKKSFDIIGKKNDIISIIPLTPVSGLKYKGLKWQPPDNTKFGWFGVRNRLLGKKGNIRLNRGKILVIKSKE